MIKKSKANFLNKDILDKEHWTEKEIISRTKRLGKEMLQSISIPEFSKLKLRFENVEEFDLTYHYDEIKGRRTYSFKFLDMDREILVGNFRQMLIEVILILDNLDSTRMDAIAEEIFNPWESKRDRLSNSNNLEEDQYHQELRENLYLMGNFSSLEVIESIRKLMSIYGIDENEFLFYLKVDG